MRSQAIQDVGQENGISQGNDLDDENYSAWKGQVLKLWGRRRFHKFEKF